MGLLINSSFHPWNRQRTCNVRRIKWIKWRNRQKNWLFEIEKESISLKFIEVDEQYRQKEQRIERNKE